MTPISPTDSRGGNRIASSNGRHECGPYDSTNRYPRQRATTRIPAPTGMRDLNLHLPQEYLQPLPIEGHVIELDTTDFETIDYELLFAQIEMALNE